MAYLSDASSYVERGTLRLLAASLGAFRKAAEPKPDTPISAGPLPEALIEADYARLASFGSWEALRSELREKACAKAQRPA